MCVPKRILNTDIGLYTKDTKDTKAKNMICECQGEY